MNNDASAAQRRRRIVAIAAAHLVFIEIISFNISFAACVDLFFANHAGEDTSDEGAQSPPVWVEMSGLPGWLCWNG
jgi:hypothetical protein